MNRYRKSFIICQTRLRWNGRTGQRVTLPPHASRRPHRWVSDDAERSPAIRPLWAWLPSPVATTLPDAWLHFASLLCHAALCHALLRCASPRSASLDFATFTCYDRPDARDSLSYATRALHSRAATPRFCCAYLLRPPGSRGCGFASPDRLDAPATKEKLRQGNTSETIAQPVEVLQCYASERCIDCNRICRAHCTRRALAAPAKHGCTQEHRVLELR